MVRLHVPPRVGREMVILESPDGFSLLDGKTVVARASVGRLDVGVPEPPKFEVAEQASEGYVGFSYHPFPTCFVCGPKRNVGDGLRIFPGTLADSPLVAAPWTPHVSLGDEDGLVRPEFVWSALDCPGAFSFEASSRQAVVLGELTAKLFCRVRVGERCVVVGWSITNDGRKHKTGTALFGEAGTCRGLAVGTWFEVTQ